MVANISEHFPTPTLTLTTKVRPQHRELHALLFAMGYFTSPANYNIEDAGDGAYGL